ncbi:DUF6113 family protein [Streptomyces tendae]|uniref:DUF6113 family protein n=1 Tax=Streptomyces tendae TaxID=1932 RepID=UPI0037AFDCD2
MSGRNEPASSALAQPLRPPSLGRAALYVGLFVLGAVLGVAGALLPTEHYELVRGERGGGDGRESDLFAGVTATHESGVAS